ncbi:hypothetical protein ABE112_27360 [Priestia aryabhattai]|uniref:hypothetical protein n=1 Tax=Priestia TaxID=2800373 RepID=UPI001E62E1E9|nr:hypothetical protein [Priestia megaterium]MCE4093322.1 hypothetical protein [Priestia megaterium]
MNNKQNKNQLEVERDTNDEGAVRERKSMDLSKKGFLKASLPIIALGAVVLFATLKNHGFLF